MFCSNCGTANADGSAFCIQCGRPLAIAVPAAVVAAPFPAVATGPQLYYAGFWLRFVAYLIDMVILVFAEFVLAVILIFGTGVISVIRRLPENPTPDEIFTGTVIFAIVMFVVGMTVLVWLYYAWMESSPSQGTLGKMALGLIVTDMQYRPVSFARASGRFFAKFITGLIPLWIGYIMAGFTAKKQALHDMIASCLVLRKI
ncbi:MAG TPA: RDD family protein [Candidatus Acidoferrales bacterium]|nr:RDD family protein [Candidatus Acidoferrales bacterium]